MNEQDINNLIDKRIDDYMKVKQFSVSKIPNHTHNGTDTKKIEAVNVIQNIKYVSGFNVDTSGTYVINGLNINNISRLVLHGFAANNADGSPATKRAIINGETQFGKIYSFAGVGTSTVSVVVQPTGIPLTSICNAMYVDSTDLTKNRVSIGGGYNSTYPNGLIVYVIDDTSSIVASMTIDSYTYNSITLTVVLGTNWKIQSNLLIT